jgi:AcrR family transcriptional regulator
MPRHRDVRVEGNIINAAYNLLEEGGEHALTMRAVAKRAGTTTPTVYHRFKDKRDLAELVREKARQKLLKVLAPSHTPEQICERLLDFAIENGNLYRLLTAEWAVRLGQDLPKPSFELAKSRLAERLGGAPEDHWELAMALGALVHGTATMLLAEGIDDSIAKNLRRICNESCKALIEHAEHAASGGQQRRNATAPS